MPKNTSLEKYPELWAVRQDWSGSGEAARMISSSTATNDSLLRERHEIAEELWVKMVPNYESDGKIVQAPWESGISVALAAARVTEPGYRIKWLAIVSNNGQSISVLIENGANNAPSLMEMVLVCAHQIPLFAPDDSPQSKAA